MTKKVKQENGITFLLRANSLIPHKMNYCFAVYLLKRGFGF